MFVSLLKVFMKEEPEDVVRAFTLARTAEMRTQTVRLTTVPADVELLKRSSLQTGNM